MESISRALASQNRNNLLVPYADYQLMIQEVLSLRKQIINFHENINKGDSSNFLQSRVIEAEEKYSRERNKNLDLNDQLEKLIKDRDFFKTQYEKENKQYTEVSQK